jgi:GNAT superfamily N-acetyltransferase
VNDRAAEDIVIRQAIPADWPTIAAIHTSSWRSAYRGLLSERFLAHEVEADRERTWQQRFSSANAGRFAVFVADELGRAVGFACLRPESPRLVLLDNLHVLPGRTGQRIGRRLLTHAARWTVVNAPGAALYLWVLEGNAAARGFYRAFGAIEHAVEPHMVADGGCLGALKCEWPDPRVLCDRG